MSWNNLGSLIAVCRAMNEWIFQVGCQGPLTQVYKNWNTSFLSWYCLLGESHPRKGSLRPSPFFSLPDRGRPRGRRKRGIGRPETGHGSGEAESSQLRHDNGEPRTRRVCSYCHWYARATVQTQGSTSCQRNCALKFSQRLHAKPLSFHLSGRKKNVKQNKTKQNLQNPNEQKNTLCSISALILILLP